MIDATATPSGTPSGTTETRGQYRGRDHPEPFGTVRATVIRASGRLRRMPVHDGATSTARRLTDDA